jgi:hypothetical protein
MPTFRQTHDTHKQNRRTCRQTGHAVPVGVRIRSRFLQGGITSGNHYACGAHLRELEVWRVSAMRRKRRTKNAQR